MHKRKPEPEDTQKIDEAREPWMLVDEGATPNPMPDGVPHWDGIPGGADRIFLLPAGPPPHGTFRRVTITEETNDKEWMHRNMDLADFEKAFNKQFEKLWQTAAMFAVGMVMMGVLIWILA